MPILFYLFDWNAVLYKSDILSDLIYDIVYRRDYIGKE